MLIYNYGNAIVRITKPQEEHLRNIRKSTETFLRKIIEEEIKRSNGNSNSSGNF